MLTQEDDVDVHVPCPSGAEGVVQFRVADQLAARFVDQQLVAAGRPEGVVLGFGMLVATLRGRSTLGEYRNRGSA